MKKLFLFAACMQLWIPACALRIGEMSPTRRSERLGIEKGRLAELTDPVAKTRSYIMISQYLIEFIGDATRERAIEDIKTLIEEYNRTIQAARDTIVKSGRDAERRPQGYKDLELSLRGHTRRFQDLRALLTADDREPLDQAIRLAADLREEMLTLLFPLGNSRPTTGT